MKPISAQTQEADFCDATASRHASGKLYAVLLGITLFLSTTAIPLGMGLTTTRLAIVLLILLSLPKLFNDPVVHLWVFSPFLAAIIAFIAALLSMAVNGGTIWPVVSWIMLGWLSALIGFCVNDIDDFSSNYFVAAFIFFYFALMAYYYLKMYQSGILITSGMQIREWENSEIATGLNRFNNSLFITFAVCFGALRFGMMKSFLVKAFTFISLILSLYTIVISGSRQNLIACFIAVVLMIFLSINVRHLFSILFRRIPSLILMIFLVFMVVMFAIKQEWFDMEFIHRRFVSNIENKTITTGDETRLEIAAAAIDCSLMNSGFGVGPGKFSSTAVLRPAHNGYLGFIAENGILNGGVALLIVFTIIIFSFKRRGQKKAPLSIIVWAIFLTIMLFSTNLKDLFREPLFWSMFGLANGIGKN